MYDCKILCTFAPKNKIKFKLNITHMQHTILIHQPPIFHPLIDDLQFYSKAIHFFKCILTLVVQQSTQRRKDSVHCVKSFLQFHFGYIYIYKLDSSSTVLINLNKLI